MMTTRAAGEIGGSGENGRGGARLVTTRALRPEDVLDARRVWLANSVRGFVEVRVEREREGAGPGPGAREGPGADCK